jgi:hypothetical protein
MLICRGTDTLEVFEQKFFDLERFVDELDRIDGAVRPLDVGTGMSLGLERPPRCTR